MTEKELDLLWNKVLSDIEPQISRANFLTLFKTTILLSFEEGTVTIGAPSPMIIDLLKKRFATIITTSVEKHSQKPASLVFAIKTVSLPTTEEKPTGPLFSAPEQKTQ